MYFFIKTIQLSNWGQELFKFYDTRGDTSEQARAYIDVANLYFISKLVDMFDTFFMAFRKRDSQISFLHVWHHTSLSYAGWLYMKYNPCKLKLFYLGHDKSDGRFLILPYVIF